MPRGVGVRVSSSSLSIAEIAQLVEHNLAKVGVASSSLVFRSMLAQVAELVDAHVSGACVERRAGSTPVLGTDSRGSVFKYRTSFILPHIQRHCQLSEAGKGSHGYYWTKSLDEDDPYDAHYLSFAPAGHLGSNTYHIDASYDRVHGFPVRAVIHQ